MVGEGGRREDHLYIGVYSLYRSLYTIESSN